MTVGMEALSATTFDELVGHAAEPVLVDFSPEWCGPCRIVEPILSELSNEYEGRLRIARVNVDDEPDLVMRFNVMSIPMLILFRDGQPIERLVGARAKQQLIKELSPDLDKHRDHENRLIIQR